MGDRVAVAAPGWVAGAAEQFGEIGPLSPCPGCCGYKAGAWPAGDSDGELLVAGLTMRPLAEGVGVTIATLIRQFGSKDQLIEDLSGYSRDDVWRLWSAIPNSKGWVRGTRWTRCGSTGSIPCRLASSSFCSSCSDCHIGTPTVTGGSPHRLSPTGCRRSRPL